MKTWTTNKVFSFKRRGDSCSTDSANPTSLLLMILPKNAIPLTQEDLIKKAETIQALDLVHKTQSFASCNKDNEKFHLMFPDSDIAKGYKQQESKV